MKKALVMRTRATHMVCKAAFLVAFAFIAAIAHSPASAQPAEAQAQADSFAFAPQRLSTDATSGRALRSSNPCTQADTSFLFDMARPSRIKPIPTPSISRTSPSSVTSTTRARRWLKRLVIQSDGSTSLSAKSTRAILIARSKRRCSPDLRTSGRAST